MSEKQQCHFLSFTEVIQTVQHKSECNNYSRLRLLLEQRCYCCVMLPCSPLILLPSWPALMPVSLPVISLSGTPQCSDSDTPLLLSCCWIDTLNNVIPLLLPLGAPFHNVSEIDREWEITETHTSKCGPYQQLPLACDLHFHHSKTPSALNCSMNREKESVMVLWKMNPCYAVCSAGSKTNGLWHFKKKKL